MGLRRRCSASHDETSRESLTCTQPGGVTSRRRHDLEARK